MSDDSEWKKLPTDEKCEHKNWKARLEGYEEAAKLFKMSDDPKGGQYMTYLGLVKKFVIDSNQVAQDKGLEAAIAFVENIPVAAKTVGEVMPGIIAKCMNAKPKIKEKAYELIMMYIEVEKQESVQEELIKGLENKQPKVVQACLEILKIAISQYGSKIMPIKPVIKSIPKLLGDRDKTVREEAKLISVEMYRWAGNAIMPQLQSVTPLIMSELEEGFKDIKEGNAEKARQTRFLRSQQDLKAKMEAESEQGDSGGSGGSDVAIVGGEEMEIDEAIDPYDLLDPVDILSRLPKDYKEKTEAKKWQERKEALDALLLLIEKNPRLQPADYYEVVHDLQKMIAKDSNVNIAVTAAKCINGIALGIRKEFSKYAQMCLTPLLERTKEKKPHIVEVFREACNAIFPSTNYENIAELTTACLAHKTPIVRTQTAFFLARCFSMATTATLAKKVLKLYLPAFIKNLSEADSTVRESSLEALGSLLKALGEKVFMPYIVDVEQIKQDKIKEYAEKCVLLNGKGEPRAGQVQDAPKVVAPPKSGPTIVKPSAKPSSAPAAAKKSAVGTSKAPAKKVAKPVEEKKGPIEEQDLHSESVEEKAQELLTPEVYASLSVSNWKERLSAVETISNKIKQMPSDEVPVQILVRTIAKKPGFKDAHFQVLKQRIELISLLAADSAYKFSGRSASYCVAEIAEKIGDLKVGEQARDALSKISDQCTLAHVASIIIPSVFGAKNPKNHENLLLWLSTSIREFGFQGLDVKFLLKHIKDSLTNTNPGIRNATYPLIGTVHIYVGPSFGSLFEQEKPAILELINAEIEKVRGEPKPVPTRGKNVPKVGQESSAGAENGDEDEENDDPAEQQRKQEALLPRTDISEQLNDTLMDQMNDKNWKERQAALEKLEQILRDNKFIEANLSEFPTHLVKRLTDTNKILATTSLKIAEKLAIALGSQGRRYVGVLAPGMISALSDAKPAVRITALSTLTSWFDNCGGLAPFLEGDMLMEALNKATNPNIKAEMCGWLNQVLTKIKKGKIPAELKVIVPCIFIYIEDRNPEVRTKSNELLVPLMLHVGPNDMLRAMNKAKPTSIKILQPLVENARAQVAAMQPAPVKAAPAVVRPAAVVKKPAKTIYDDSPDESYDPEPVAAAPVKKTNAIKEKKEAKKEAEKPAPPKKKGGEDDDFGPIMQCSDKQQRMNTERALKSLKWNFDAPRKEFVEQLRNQIEHANFNKTLITQLFHDDFKKQILAIDTLTRAITECSDAAVSNLDLLLRWLSLRFFETNPTVMLKIIEFQIALFDMLIEKKYHMSDFEANGYIPYFIGKLGDRQDSIRKGFRQVIKSIAQCHPPVKVFNFLLQGLASKNSRQRTECLEELGMMIEAIGLNTFNPAVTIKEIAKQISDRDNGVRSAALNVVTIAWQIVGDKVHKYTGKLNDKEFSYLEERIKRSAKLDPKPVPQKVEKESSHDKMPQILPKSSSVNSLANSRSNVPPEVNGNHGFSQEDKMNGQPRPLKNTTPKKYQTITKSKGEFCLDLNDDEDDRNGDIQIKLAPHSGLDELLNQPVEMPPPRKNNHTYPMSILKESEDCHGAIDLVITHISHQKLDISFQNLVQIDVVIKDKEKKDLLVPHIDNLLNTCALKLNVAHNVYLNGDYQVEEVFRLFKGLFSVVLDIFDNDLGKHASPKTLKDVIYNLLCVMIDQKILTFNEGDQLIKAINIVTLRLLELSNQTTSYCALVKLLNESCQQEASYASSKYLELVMKCIWRQIRRLSSSAGVSNEALIAQIDTSQVLQEIHTFLSLYPSSSWQGKQSDLPLRTVKTLLFHLAKAKQGQILEDLNSINVPDDSEIKIYIVKLFKNGFQLTNSNNTSHNSSSTVNNNCRLKQSTSEQCLVDNTDKMTQLRQLVRKISSEQSKESLLELYHFKQQNTDIDLDKYFEKSSGKLKSYIMENLRVIESEQGCANKPSPIKKQNTNTFLTNDLSKADNGTRNVDDIIKTIADWKSKTHLNILDNDDNDENNIRAAIGSSPFKNRYDSSNYSKLTSGMGNGSSGRLYQGSHRTTTLNTLENNFPSNDPTDIKAEKYQNIVKDLKKKYTRSRTESDQLSDLKALDMKSKNFNENSSSGSSNLNSLNLQQTEKCPSPEKPASSEYSQMSSENLYDEYKRRLELIKKIKTSQ